MPLGSAGPNLHIRTGNAPSWLARAESSGSTLVCYLRKCRLHMASPQAHELGDHTGKAGMQTQANGARRRLSRRCLPDLLTCARKRKDVDYTMLLRRSHWVVALNTEVEGQNDMINERERRDRRKAPRRWARCAKANYEQGGKRRMSHVTGTFALAHWPRRSQQCRRPSDPPCTYTRAFWCAPGFTRTLCKAVRVR
jgi:hypothetical protein